MESNEAAVVWWIGVTLFGRTLGNWELPVSNDSNYLLFLRKIFPLVLESDRVIRPWPEIQNWLAGWDFEEVQNA